VLDFLPVAVDSYALIALVVP